jgi:hypothetical protein
MEQDDCDEILDDSWINEFAKSDKLYQEFYKDDIYYTDVHFVYVGKNSEIVSVKQESILFKNKNYLTRDELVGLIKRNSVVDSTRYSVMSILKYNITLDPVDIKSFVFGQEENYLTPIKNIDTIKFDKTIHMLQDINDLLIILYEKHITNSNNSTRKVYLQTKLKSKGTRKQPNFKIEQNPI